jgi:hypothetical protein
MPSVPFLQSFVAVSRDPGQHVRLKPGRPSAIRVQSGKVNQNIDAPTDQMDVRRSVVTLAKFKPVLSAKAVLGRHGAII